MEDQDVEVHTLETIIAKDYVPGMVDAALLITGEAEGAIPIGTRVRKCNTKEGDTFIDGAGGYVLSSLDVPEDIRHTVDGSEYAYFIKWDTAPMPVLIAGHRVEVADAEGD